MRPQLPTPLNLFLIAIGALAIGAKAAAGVAPTPDTRTVVEPGETRTLVSTHTIRRRVHGKVVTRNEKVYIQVPLVVVHTDHHTIRVPQHLLPLRSAAQTVANPLVTVYVAVPTTVYVPTTVTETTPPSTETVTIPTTITLPLDPTASDQEEP